MEILVRLATDKHLKTGLVNRHSEAVAHMLDEHCLPAIKLFNSDRFRYDRYEEVDEVFKAYLIILRYLNNANSARHVKPGQKPFMSLQLRFTTREIDITLNLAMMTHINELDCDHHFQMTFVEFLEALARVAEKAAHPEISLVVCSIPKEYGHQRQLSWIFYVIFLHF
jgi:hypothetical protein